MKLHQFFQTHHIQHLLATRINEQEDTIELSVQACQRTFRSPPFSSLEHLWNRHPAWSGSCKSHGTANGTRGTAECQCRHQPGSRLSSAATPTSSEKKRTPFVCLKPKEAPPPSHSQETQLFSKPDSGMFQGAASPSA